MAKCVGKSSVACDGSGKNEPPTLGEEVSFDWANLAASQGAVTKDAILSQNDGHVFAMEDRSSAAHGSWRRVLVRVQRKQSEVHVFGAEGSIIEDSNKRVFEGKQALNLFLEQFEQSGKHLYRSPQIRAHPRERNTIHPAVQNSGQSARKVRVALRVCSKHDAVSNTMIVLELELMHHRVCGCVLDSNSETHKISDVRRRCFFQPPYRRVHCSLGEPDW